MEREIDYNKELLKQKKYIKKLEKELEDYRKLVVELKTMLLSQERHYEMSIA